jgi:hypothetical protein
MEKRPSSPSTPENIFCSPAGYTVSKFPLLNKGTSFSQKDRDAHGLRGLIPAGDPLPLEAKVELTMEQLRKKATPLDKYIFLHTLQDADVSTRRPWHVPVLAPPSSPMRSRSV